MINKILVSIFVIGCSFFAKAQIPTHDQFLTACNESGVGEACWALGYSYEAGKDFHKNRLKRNLVVSANYYQKGCELGEARACFNLGNNLGQNIYQGLSGMDLGQKDALLFLQKGCSLNHKGACYNYASVIRQFKNGRGKAIWGFKKACKLGVQEACTEVEKMN